MKSIKIGFVLLAALFAVSSAFTTQKKVTATGEKWFIYDGSIGPKTSVSSYQVDEVQTETCDDAATPLCRIFVLPDANNPAQPDLSAFNTLKSVSSTFTVRIDQSVQKTRFQE